MAGWTGLEPAASAVTGRRYNQLNYHPAWVPRFSLFSLKHQQDYVYTDVPSACQHKMTRSKITIFRSSYSGLLGAAEVIRESFSAISGF